MWEIRLFLTWRKVAVSIVPVTLVFAVLAAFVLDVLMIRPIVDGGSVNTLLPGITYAMATIMKVCIAEGIILTIFAMLSYLHSRKSEVLAVSLPVWTIFSLVLSPFAMFAGAVVVVIAQALADLPDNAGSFTFFSRAGVFGMMVCLLAAFITSVVAMIRRETPAVVSVLGIVTAIVLVGLFYYFEFFAIGFHQDKWAPSH